MLLNYLAPLGIAPVPVIEIFPDFIGLEVIIPPGGGTDWTQALDDTITLSDSWIFDYGMFPADTLTLSDAQVNAVTITLADIITLDDAIDTQYTAVRLYMLLKGVG